MIAKTTLRLSVLAGGLAFACSAIATTSNDANGFGLVAIQPSGDSQLDSEPVDLLSDFRFTNGKGKGPNGDGPPGKPPGRPPGGPPGDPPGKPPGRPPKCPF